MSGGTVIAERILARVAHVDTGHGSPCWLWQGPQTLGYCRVDVGGRKKGWGHRIMYEALRGPIPDGLVIDHLCRQRACVNPHHLEPVTQAENTRRGKLATMRSHCRQGHPFDAANTRIEPRGFRVCRTCELARMRIKIERRSALRKAVREKVNHAVSTGLGA